ncbi:MAG: SOS response-associated peptidase [Propionibacteriaceae bacterium]|nr:SOS response-associated peptidase [Propionibacteriaceae bacterium]
MCGRYSDPCEEDIVEAFHVQEVTGHKEPSANVCPTQPVSIVVQDEALRKLRLARWGLIPSWAKGVDARPLINARAETVIVKPSFRAAAARRRAIAPALGYYEWAASPPGRKQPWFLQPEDGGILGFAGLYEWWRIPDGVTPPAGADDGWLCSCTIITRPAVDVAGRLHDRMPVVVPPDLIDTWLEPTLTNLADVENLLAAMPAPALVPIQQSPLGQSS